MFVDFMYFHAIQAAGVIASAFYWFLLFAAVTLIELVCKEIKAMLKQMSCEIHTNFSDCFGCAVSLSLSVSVSVCVRVQVIFSYILFKF